MINLRSSAESDISFVLPTREIAFDTPEGNTTVDTTHMTITNHQGPDNVAQRYSNVASNEYAEYPRSLESRGETVGDIYGTG